MDGFCIDDSDQSPACESNLQKLSLYIGKYMKTNLKPAAQDEKIDIKAIVKNGSKEPLLLLVFSVSHHTA